MCKSACKPRAVPCPWPGPGPVAAGRENPVIPYANGQLATGPPPKRFEPKPPSQVLERTFGIPRGLQRGPAGPKVEHHRIAPCPRPFAVPGPCTGPRRPSRRLGYNSSQHEETQAVPPFGPSAPWSWGSAPGPAVADLKAPPHRRSGPLPAAVGGGRENRPADRAHPRADRGGVPWTGGDVAALRLSVQPAADFPAATREASAEGACLASCPRRTSTG